MARVRAIYPLMEVGLKLIGLFPGVSQIKVFVLIFLIVVINIPFQIWNAIDAYGDVDRFMKNFGPTMIMMNFVIKLIVFRLSQRRVVKHLINGLIDDCTTLDKSGDNKVMAKNMKTCDSVYKLIAVSYNAMIIFGIAVSIASYNDTKSIEHTDYFIPVTYPYIAKNWANYILVNFFLLFQMFACANVQAIIDGFLALMVFHAATQVHNIRSALKRYSDACSITTDRVKINRALRDFLFLHQKYLDFVANVEKAFTYIILSELVSLTLTMVAVEYGILTMIDNNAMTADSYFYLNFLIGDLLSAATYCAAGEYFIIQSDYIYRDLCQCPWYKFHSKDMKTMLILLPKLQRPPVITYGKLGKLSLFCFTSILNTSFAYLSVFRAIKTRQNYDMN